MRRRAVLRLSLAAIAWTAAGGHTPYRQWALYRRKHLLVGTCRADAPSYPLGKRIAETLAEYLPESEARVSRAPDQWRLASLITTGQMEVILLSDADARALAAGAPPFEDFGPTVLTALFQFGDHVLLTRPDFPDRHAWLVVRTLTERAGDFENARPALDATAPTPVHPGARAYAEGAPEPEPPAVVEALPDPGPAHGH